MADDKTHLNVVFIGHVDHGKSTTIGRLLFDTGTIRKEMIDEFEEQGDKGKTFKFAWVMDSVSEERERGLTIDVAHKKFETDSRYITIIDAPGHKDFVKNMITGTSQADAGVLVVDATDGVMPQTKEHLFLAKTLGIKRLIVTINKMDMVDYDQEKFEQRKDEINDLLKMVGYDPSDVKIIPASAWEGDNVAEQSEEMDWYTGPTVLKMLDDLEEPPKPVDKPLRLPVEDIYTIKGVGTVPVGRVETGIMEKGDKVKFEPASTVYGDAIQGEVKNIEMHHEQLEKAEPGDNVGFNVRGIGKDDISRGDVASHPKDPSDVITPNDTFKAQIFVMQHPSAITAGYTPVFHAHTAQVACTFEDLVAKLNPKSGKVEEENPDILETGQAGIVKIRPTRPMVLEQADEIPEMGQFAIRDMGQTVAAGKCISVNRGDSGEE